MGLAVGLLALASFIMVTVGGALFIAGAGVLLAVNIQALQGEGGEDPSPPSPPYPWPCNLALPPLTLRNGPYRIQLSLYQM